MIVFESNSVRRLLIRPERGDELVSVLSEAAEARRVGCARVMGWGVFEDVVLERTSPQAPLERLELEGPALATSIVGTVGHEADATVAQVFLTVQTSQGVVSGRALSAVVVAGELFIDAFDDADPARIRDRVTGLVTFRAARGTPDFTEQALSEPSAEAPKVEEASPAAPEGGGAWAAVAAASEGQEADVTPKPARAPKGGRARRPGAGGLRQRSSRRIAREIQDAKVPAHKPKPLPQRQRAVDESFFEDPIPERGSYVDHPQLGRCFVIDEDRNGDLVLRLPGGGHRTLRLELMRVEGPEQQEVGSVYRVRPKGPRIS